MINKFNNKQIIYLYRIGVMEAREPHKNNLGKLEDCSSILLSDIIVQTMKGGKLNNDI